MPARRRGIVHAEPPERLRPRRRPWHDRRRQVGEVLPRRRTMEVIHTVRLHRTKGYPMDAVWYHVDPDTQQRGPDVEVSASRVHDRLREGHEVVARFPGSERTCRCCAVTLDHRVETFDLETPHASDESIQR